MQGTTICCWPHIWWQTESYLKKEAWQATLWISKQTAKSIGGMRKDLLMLCAPVHAKGLQKHMAISCFHRLLDHPHAAQTEARKVCHEGGETERSFCHFHLTGPKPWRKKGFVQIGKVNQCSIHETCIIHCVWSSSPFIIGINMSRYLNHVDRHR